MKYCLFVISLVTISSCNLFEPGPLDFQISTEIHCLAECRFNGGLFHGSNFRAFFVDIDSNLVRTSPYSSDFIENILFNEDEIWIVQSEDIHIHDKSNFERMRVLEEIKTSSEISHLYNGNFYYIRNNFLYFFDEDFIGITDSIELENTSGIYEFQDRSLYYSTTDNNIIKLGLDNFSRLSTHVGNPISYINSEDNNIAILINSGAGSEAFRSSTNFPFDFKIIEISEQLETDASISTISFINGNLLVEMNKKLYYSENNLIESSDLIPFSSYSGFTINHTFGIIYTFDFSTIQYMHLSEGVIQTFDYDLELGIDILELHEIK